VLSTIRPRRGRGIRRSTYFPFARLADTIAKVTTTTPVPARPAVAEMVTAVASAALAVGGALALPALAAADPEAGVPFLSPTDAAWWVAVAVVAVQAAVLLWSRRAPGAVLLAVTLAPAVHAAVIPGPTFSLTTVAVSFAVFWTVVREPVRRAAVLVPVVGVVVAASQAANDVRAGAAPDLVTIGTALLQALSVVAIPLVIGLFYSARQDARASRAHELLALKRERDALIQAAVSRERIAMSRELHDIAAHHMSGIALLASAIYRQIDLDPEAAKLSAQQVRAQSTTVLDDLRRVIGLLRDEAESSRVVETLAAVGELVELRRAAGVDVRFELLTGERELGAGIGPLAQLVAYRMVQESLANAAAHAPGANCVVEIDDRDAGLLTVRVENDGAHAPDLGPGSGFGLVGMRERADLVAGDLDYGPADGGGWRVRLVLRRDGIIRDVTEADA
jgi:signal transduction histidine kinase